MAKFQLMGQSKQPWIQVLHSAREVEGSIDLSPPLEYPPTYLYGNSRMLHNLRVAPHKQDIFRILHHQRPDEQPLRPSHVLWIDDHHLHPHRGNRRRKKPFCGVRSCCLRVSSVMNHSCKLLLMQLRTRKPASRIRTPTF
jgi:hypothetical protein